MRNHLPIVYLVDSAGVNLPYQDGIFPGQYGLGVFSITICRCGASCDSADRRGDGGRIAGGAYPSALSDVIIMVESVSFMGLGGPNLVKGATGQVIDSEPLGGAHLHTATARRGAFHGEGRCRLPVPHPPAVSSTAGTPRGSAQSGARAGTRRRRSLRRAVSGRSSAAAAEIEEVITRIFDAGDYSEFQPEYAPEILCANAVLSGHPVAIVANRRGFLKSEGRPRIGGIIYAETARKVAYFVETAERLGQPLIYLQDVSGFMVGPEAEREGIIRAGAEMVESMSCATVPKIVLTLNHASGAGYYAMAGQGFYPNFTFIWPTARIGVMEGESAIQALYAVELEKARAVRCPTICSRRYKRRGRITNAGWMRSMRRRAATATR